jgi:hypothetical protein
MDFYTTELFAASIFLAGLIAVFRFKQIRPEYYPFIWMIWAGCLNEIVSFIMAMNGLYNVLNSIIYGLCESMLLLWFFQRLGVFKKRPVWLWVLVLLFLVIWIMDSFFSKRFGQQFNSYFSFLYSFTVVILSINAINKLLFRERSLLRHPSFLICASFTIYFTYKMITEIFWFYGFGKSEGFTNDVFYIFVIVNLLCNLIYALAILWMKKKQAFTLQF